MLNTFALLIPFFLILVLIEWYIRFRIEYNKYPISSVFMNMSVGAIDQLGSLIYFPLLYFTLKYVYK